MSFFDRRRQLEGAQVQFRPGAMNPNANGLDVPVGLGPAPYQPSQPRGAPSARRIVLPGCDYPPADAIPLDTIPEADIAASASATVATITIPDTLTLRIAGIGFGADDESALRFLSWKVNVTPPGTPITPYINMPAAIGSITQPSWVFINIGSSYVITLIVTNNASVTPNTYHYFVRLVGWFYSEKEAAA